MIYSTIVKGDFAGVAIVFPPEWGPERVASVLSALSAQVIVSKPYIVTKQEEITKAISDSDALAKEKGFEHIVHFKNHLS
ncbi:MAG: hypothetical protein FWD25_00770 [Clostridia bacterium]|nr:hypothetical protein [Clostridia bacterium]